MQKLSLFLIVLASCNANKLPKQDPNHFLQTHLTVYLDWTFTGQFYDSDLKKLIQLSPFNPDHFDPIIKNNLSKFKTLVSIKLADYFKNTNITIARSKPTESFYRIVVSSGDMPPNKLGAELWPNPFGYGVIYADNFKPWMRSDRRTFDEMAQMLANTAAHEIGHKLGMWHAPNQGTIMSNDKSRGLMWEKWSWK